jgi:predicted nucleic acid-binding protein
VAQQTVLVADSSVLIDLHIGQILRTALRLPFDIITVDAVIGELAEPDGASLQAQGLRVIELSGEQVLEVERLSQRYRRPSTTDLFALVLARSVRGTLLTGDRHLREAAEADGVDVHGTLWLLDEMVGSGALSPTEAGDALERMVAQGRRLPEREVAARLRRWR